MSRDRIPESKKGLVGRVAEILRAYLYHEDESYAVIDMYFEKKNGESQHKRLRFGAPSDGTPEEYRDYPEGFFDVESEDGSLDVCSMAETVFRIQQNRPVGILTVPFGGFRFLNGDPHIFFDLFHDFRIRDRLYAVHISFPFCPVWETV